MSTPHEGATSVTDNEIAERIHNALIIKNRNVKDLSEDTGINYKRLRLSLKGERSMTVTEIEKIASVFKVKPSALLPDTFARRSAA